MSLTNKHREETEALVGHEVMPAKRPCRFGKQYWYETVYGSVSQAMEISSYQLFYLFPWFVYLSPAGTDLQVGASVVHPKLVDSGHVLRRVNASQRVSSGNADRPGHSLAVHPLSPR